MSRSNPTVDNPNPSSRWFEWNGEDGIVRWYDKQAKKNVPVKLPFTFILLDRLGTIKGFHEKSKSGIYSNEVRDTRAEPLVVKSFEGGPIASGIYADIKDRVHTAGGAFTVNCYIAYKGDDKELRIGAIQFKGAALGEWFEFEKKNRKDIYTKAVKITGFEEDKKGKIVFRTPVFELTDVADETNGQAVALDKVVQEYLDGYFKRTRVDQAKPADRQTRGAEAPQPDAPADEAPPGEAPTEVIEDQDVPF